MRLIFISFLVILVSCQPAFTPPEGMVFVQGGSFMMGSTDSVIDSLINHNGYPRSFLASESPPHEVTLSSFYMDTHEVTNGQFKAFTDQNPFWSKDQIPDSLHNGNYLIHWDANNFPEGGRDFPIINISWYAALKFCEWRGKRLPTEAEWEFAAGNKGSGITYPWGNDPPDSTRTNYRNKIGQAVEVGSYPSNKLGIFDLAGNVWEYTMDAWSSDFYTNSPAIDPVNGSMSYPGDRARSVKTRRVIRGGSWGGADVNLRVKFRDSHPAPGAGDHVGCRCVKEIK